MWNLKYYTNEPIYETKTDREQTCGCQPGGQGAGGGRDGLGVWDEQMQTIIFRMDKQQSPTV